jgi:hypothetical protein
MIKRTREKEQNDPPKTNLIMESVKSHCKKLVNSIDDLTEEQIRNITRGVNFGFGVGVGAFDATTSGYPYVTLAYLIYDIFKVINSSHEIESYNINPRSLIDDENQLFIEFSKNKIAYLAGAAIPLLYTYYT